MCLTVNNEATDKFRKKHRNDREVVVWKVYNVNAYDYGSGMGVHPPWCPGPHYLAPVTPGTVKSNRRSLDISAYNNHDVINPDGLVKISRGMHVYLTRKEARRHSKVKYRKVFRCTAKMSDFVAAGGYSHIGAKNNQAVFMKIKISKTDFYRGKRGSA